MVILLNRSLKYEIVHASVLLLHTPSRVVAIEIHLSVITLKLVR